MKMGCQSRPPQPSAAAWRFLLALVVFLTASASALSTGRARAQAAAPEFPRPAATPGPATSAAAASAASDSKTRATARPKAKETGKEKDKGAPRPETKPLELELRVTSKAAAELLRPPGTSRYDSGAIDWRDVPPWRQVSFFGIRAQGQFFVYVVDCSGSMLDDDRLIRAKSELRRSINNLQYPQRFYVIFYNDRPIPMLGDLPRSADLSAKNQLNLWLRLIQPDGDTDPRSAMSLALSLQPDAVFLLSDGEYPGGAVEAIGRRNTRKVPIHCIDLSGGLAGDQLLRIARESGGQYAARPPRTDQLSP